MAGLEWCSSATDVLPSWNLSTHWYTLLSLIQLLPHCWMILLWISLGFIPSDHKNIVTERCSSLVQFSSGVVMLRTLSFESCLSCHQLHTVRTCPIDVSTHCRSFMRLRLILVNIPSIFPYVLKSPHIYRICPAVFFMLHQLLLRKVTVWKYFNSVTTLKP
jgi:hypothetical protein